MKRILFALVLLVSVAGCEVVENPGNRVVKKERPVVNVPLALRQSNWLGSNREGSCVHASMISLFRWQGRPDLAKKWRETYGDGEWWEGLAAKFDKEGVRYAYTVKRNDVSFLQWACSTRRGCGVTVRGGAHMVTLVHLDSKWAGILDNNSIEEIKWVRRETFLSEWFSSNSWAVTPIYTPPPPLPYRSP